MSIFSRIKDAFNPQEGVVDNNPPLITPPFQEINQQFINRQEAVNLPSNQIDLTFMAPTLINMMGDLHVGHPTTQYNRIGQEVQAICDTPNSYVILVGDLIDNMCWNPGQFEQMEQTPVQIAYVRAMLEQLGREGKILLSIQGDHDGWTTKAGYNLQSEMAQYGAHATNGPTHIIATVGDQEYNLMGAHQLPGHSMYNKNHPQERAERFGSGRGADVIFSAHNHQKGHSEDTVGGEDGLPHKVDYVAIGPYKETDSWLQKKGFDPQFPVPEQMFGSSVRLDDKKHQVVYEADILEANRKQGDWWNLVSQGGEGVEKGNLINSGELDLSDPKWFDFGK